MGPLFHVRGETCVSLCMVYEVYDPPSRALSTTGGCRAAGSKCPPWYVGSTLVGRARRVEGLNLISQLLRLLRTRRAALSGRLYRRGQPQPRVLERVADSTQHSQPR
jgi:hypothetical protein